MLMVTVSNAFMFKWLWVSAAVLVLDQWSKSFMVSWLSLHQQKAVYPDPTLVAEMAMQNQFPSYGFNFTMAHNTGAAFSFLADAGGWQHWFFLTLAVGVSVFLLFWLKDLTRDKKLEAFSLVMIIGGAIGNVIDRFNYGYVIDFIQFYADFLKPILGSPYFPAFNLADSAIFLGAILLIVDSFRSKSSNVIQDVK